MTSKLVFIFLFIFDVFSSEDNEQEHTAKKLKSTSKLFNKNILQLTEEYCEPRDSIKMKTTDNQWNKAKVTGNLNVFPNESTAKLWLDLDTQEFSWEDPDDLIHRKTQIELCMKETGMKMWSCLLFCISEWFCGNAWRVEDIERTQEAYNHAFQKEVTFFTFSMHISEGAKPFVKEVLCFISGNVDLDQRGCVTETALMLSARFDAQKAVAKLVERNANGLEEVNEYRYTALCFAALYESESACKVLLEKGADVNHRCKRSPEYPVIFLDDYDSTPLMEAAKRGYGGIVRALLEHSANVKIQDQSGKTALDYAYKNNHQNCIDLMVEY